ncbi:MAG: ribulose-phosphate 3-epimerase [Prevotellaceae bacterium]|nr:ribulose-phosphate 3-epimerase [Prevotellaceae bacterium]
MLVSPSLLAADFGNLEREMTWFNRSGADLLHLDVMDGVFVPNISFGFPVMQAVARLCKIPLDVHLMVVQPETYLDRVAALPGVRYFNFHYEATFHRQELIDRAKAKGLMTGITVRPETSVEYLRDLLPSLDLVLLMSVHPGFGGQRFIPDTLRKARRLRELILETGSKALVEVDGGVNAETSRQLAEAGVDVLVAGSFVFGSSDPLGAVASLKAL